MKIEAIDYITEDANGNVIEATKGKVFVVENRTDLEALFAQVGADMEAA